MHRRTNNSVKIIHNCVYCVASNPILLPNKTNELSNTKLILHSRKDLVDQLVLVCSCINVLVCHENKDQRDDQLEGQRRPWLCFSFRERMIRSSLTWGRVDNCVLSIDTMTTNSKPSFIWDHKRLKVVVVLILQEVTHCLPSVTVFWCLSNL